MLVFGMLSGGILLFRSITLSDTAREATRYAATLPVESTTSDWLDAVVQRAVDSANGELDATHTDRSVCVALIGTSGSDGRWLDGTTTAGTCFADGRPADESRVQVVVSRQGVFNAVFFSRTITLTGQAVARYEVTS